MANLPSMTGIVKWFSSRKGFGFITPHNGGPDVFVRRGDIVGRDSLKKGNWVQFEVIQHPRGPRARNVRVLE